MEIQFNPSRVGSAPAVQPVAKGRAATSAGDSASLDQTGALKQAINNIPLVRPEKVAAARASVADTHFPPDAMLKAIAALIADKIQ